MRYRNPAIAAAILACLSAAILWSAIGLGVYNERANADQNIYHLRVIEQFSREFPHPNLSDYYSATGPGFHLALALVHRFISQDLTVLRVVGSLFTIVLLGLLGGAAVPAVWRTTDEPHAVAPSVTCRVAVPSRDGWLDAVLLCLPMLTSLYVFVSGVWLLPDNLAWLAVLVAMLAAFDGGRYGNGNAWFVIATVSLAAAVFVRQINLWPLGVIVVGIVLEDDQDESLAPPLIMNWWKFAALAALTGVPALIILAWFHQLWHGMTPPAFQTVHGPLPPEHSTWQHEGPNYAVPTMVSAVLAATGAFFLGFLLPAIRKILAKHPRQLAVVLIGMLIGIVLAVVVPTDFNQENGRYSGLWNISAHFPAVAHRSLFMVAMSALGGAVVALFFLALDRRDRWIWLATWACFAAAQSANAKAWHKYYEPFCLMMLALATSRVIARHGAPAWWAYVGPVLLAALLGGVTLMNLTAPPGM